MKAMDWTARAVLAVAAAAALSACTKPSGAPLDANVCWRETGFADGKSTFAVVANNDSNFENCAVHLEAVRLKEGKSVTGAYQGEYIFASAEAIERSPTRDGRRTPVFPDETRAQVDQGLNQLLDEAAKAEAADKAKAGAKK